MIKKIFTSSVVLLFFLFLSIKTDLVLADSSGTELLEGRILRVENLQEEEDFVRQNLILLVTRGSLTGEEIEVSLSGESFLYQEGDLIVVQRLIMGEGEDVFQITDFVRRNYLVWLFLFFVGCAVLVARGKAVSSLLGLFLSFLVIFKLTLPWLLSGTNPIMVALVSVLLLIPLTFYLAHGISMKTTLAVGGTVFSLILTIILSSLLINLAHLTGTASEEAMFLEATNPGLFNLKNLVLAGMILGVLGVLDDITVAQVSVVFQLKGANDKLSGRRLFRRAMEVGRDHIASMINTLILVYAGASLPLFLLFTNSSLSWVQVLNTEIVVEEIIRMLVGSIGLILAVPVTTWLAVKSLD